MLTRRGESTDPRLNMVGLKTRPTPLKRNIIVGQLADRLSHRFDVLAATRGGRRAGAAALRAPRAHSAPSAAQQHNAVASDFSGVALVAVLVVPLAGLEAPLNVDLLALGEIFRQRFRGLSPEHDAVPFGLFLLLARLVVPHLGRSHVERGHGGASGRVPQFCVAPEIAHEDDLVHTSHAGCPFNTAAVPIRAYSSRPSGRDPAG